MRAVGRSHEALLRALTALALVLAVAVFLIGPTPSRAADHDITVEQALEMSRGGKATIVDVRTQGEWRKTGIPAGAKTVTLNNPRGAQGFIDEVLGAVDGDRTKPVALICATGNRSARAAALLEANGFTNVYNVTNGMMGRNGAKGWIATGLPVAPCPAC